MTLLTEPTRIVLAKGQPVPNDPNFAFNSLLLHGNGTNGSTVITDSSGSPKTVTAVGNAQISTAQSKFGGSAIAFDGDGDYLTVPSNASFAFGTGDFTVELWAYFGDLLGFSTLVGTRTANNATTALTVGLNVSEELYFYTNGFDIITAALARNTWHHLAISRQSNNLRAFVNGIQSGSAISDGKNYSTNNLAIGSTTDFVQQFNGYIDDLRITKGIARYTSNFTPPTAPFPDF